MERKWKIVTVSQFGYRVNYIHCNYIKISVNLIYDEPVDIFKG